MKLNLRFLHLLVSLRPLSIWHNIKYEVFIQDFISKFDQIFSFFRIWLHLLKKSLKENFLFLHAAFHRRFLSADAFLFHTFMFLVSNILIHAFEVNKGSRYSRINQIKFVEDSLQNIWNDKFFKSCLP